MSRKTKSRPKRERGLRPLQRFIGPLLILVAAAVGVWPLVKMGPSCGPDFYFHFVSWIEAQRSILDGVLYPHWASGPNFGAGEPRFVFYPPLTWMTGAFLGLVVPWRAVSIVLLYLLFAATGLANRALARQMLGNGPATLAGCASIFIGNILVDGYLRGDYGELAGGFWIPLLLMFQLRRSVPSGTILHTFARWRCAVVPCGGRHLADKWAARHHGELPAAGDGCCVGCNFKIVGTGGARGILRPTRRHAGCLLSIACDLGARLGQLWSCDERTGLRY